MRVSTTLQFKLVVFTLWGTFLVSAPVWAEGPELNDLGTLWLKNIGFLTSWGYTDTTSLSQTTGQPNVPVSFQGSTASLFKLTIDKPIVDHILRYAGKGHPGTPEWDLVVKPWHIVGNISYGDTLTSTRIGTSPKDELVSKTTYAIGISYTVDFGDLGRHFRSFKKRRIEITD